MPLDQTHSLICASNSSSRHRLKSYVIINSNFGLDLRVMRELFFTAFILALFSMAPAFAVKVTSLYQYEMPVDSQADDVRAQAVREGFLQVLIKISGDPQIAENPDIKPLLRRADYFVQEFSYSAPDASPYYTLKIRYDRNDINRLLKKAGVSYWGENRPLILVWVSYTNIKNFAEIIGNENPGNILTTMKLQGKKYGLPLIFPMMDVTDIDQVSTTDIKEMSLSTLKEAGKRYAPDAMLIGAIEQTNIDFQSHWQLVLGTNQWAWNISEKLIDDVIASVLNQTSQTLAKYYVEKAANAPQWIKVEVTNITKRDELVQLMQYLKQLTAVQQVQLVQIVGDVVDISILVRGSLNAFQQNASVNQRLVLKSQDEANNKLIYQWAQ